MANNQTLQPGSYERAKRLITDFLFRASSQIPPSMFYPAVTKASLIDALRDRVDSPAKVAQEGASLCGPACFIYALLNTHPDLYVQLVLDLYQHGKSTLGKLQLEPSPKAGNIQGKRPPAPVDWIALTGMMSDYYDADQQWAGITMPGTLEAWFVQTGFKSVVDETNLSSTKGLDTLMQAQIAYTSGYNVCLFVHAEAFDAGYERDGSWFPNHWVVLNSPIQIARWDESKKALGSYVFVNHQLISELKKELAEARENAERNERYNEQIECLHRIQFTVYTWGKDAKPVIGVPQTPGAATVCYFLRHFFGYVKAKW